MRQSAVSTSDGKVMVDPSFLETIATLTQQLALGSSGQKPLLPEMQGTPGEGMVQSRVREIEKVTEADDEDTSAMELTAAETEPDDESVNAYFREIGYRPPGYYNARRTRSGPKPLVRMTSKQAPVIKKSMRRPRSERANAYVPIMSPVLDAPWVEG